MKTDTRLSLGWAARTRLFARVLGLTGLFAALVGLFVLLALGREISLNGLRTGIEGTGTAQWASALVAIGVAVAVLVLLIEVLAAVGGSGRRSASGASAAVQIVLALAVFVGINYYSFHYFKRTDLTREREFTLPTHVADELRKLRGQTTIVVLQQHKTFGQLSPKPDIYDYAAERKVVDKVHDLVEEFRLLGPQFRVVSLDVEAIGYEKQLDAETGRRPGLKEAIAAAPENSIFFYPDDRVEPLAKAEAQRRAALGRRVHSQADPKDSAQVFAYEGNIPRLSFNEFYQLDKSASKAANPGPDGEPQGNLVLRPQGIEAFARRVLAIQEKRPKVGLLIIHEALSTDLSEGWQEQYTSHGLRRTLEDHGFDVVDVLLKKWPPREEPSPAAYNKDETKFERLEAELESIEDDLRGLREERDQIMAVHKMFRESSLEDLNKKLRTRIRREITEDFRQQQLQMMEDALARGQERQAELEKDRADTEAKVQALMKNERAFEDRRVTDVKAKLARVIADCDLLIIPRHTLINTTARQYIDPPLYKLSSNQVEVIRDFMKQGKPVLACLGPNADPQIPPGVEPLDDFEKLLADRGVELGRQTVIFDVEAKGFASRQAGNLLGGAPSEIPPVTFPDPPAGKKPNPVAEAMRATAHSADQQLELRLRHPRPVYVYPGIADRMPFAPDFMVTSAASWNEEQPFPTMRQVGPRELLVSPPRYEATPFDDPKKGTHDEERRGPFPVAVAVEGAMPVEWYDAGYTDFRKAAAVSGPLDRGLLSACLSARAAVEPDKETKALVPQKQRATGRLVVIGQGGLFSGKQLSPAYEQLLLHTTNWLLNRDERLPRTDAEWTYPRVQRGDKESFLWRYGPFLGLPAAFLYLGLIVWIVRRVR
ncbi:MAG: hypothetical protein J2P46_15550 [Zavarzinella sp.]|nr:hypothetical protein [Zavarzinella sp.]